MSVSNSLLSKSVFIARSNHANTANWPSSMANTVSICINSSLPKKSDDRRRYYHLPSLNLHQTKDLNNGTTNYFIGIRSSTTLATPTVKKVKDQAPKLTKETANALVLKLTNDERTALLSTLQQFESDQLRAEYKGQLAAFRWRTKLGRPSKVPRLGDVDPTGSYCPVPEDWLLNKYAETIPKPTSSQLFGVAIHNAVPFIGFGFLDNFLMIICGDYIELTLGSFMTLSTMAAAALGNTFSDVLGLGCAGYVETLATKVGVKAPPLSPIQLDMKSSRTCANFGRGIGVTIGCLLGMIPLLFMEKETEIKDASKIEKYCSWQFLHQILPDH